MSNIKQTKSELAASAHMADGYRADVCLAHPVTGEILQPEIMHVIDPKTRLVGLLPCPFCGAQPVADVFEDEEDHFHFLSCENKACPANVCAVGNTGKEAAALWNTRNGGAA